MSGRFPYQARATAQINPNSTAYTSGDAIGTAAVKFLNIVPQLGMGGIMQSVTLADYAKQSAAVDLVFFESNPSGTTVTDNSALDIADADLPYAFVVSITASDYAAFGASSLASVNPSKAFKLNATSVLYCIPVSRGTPTYGADVIDVQIHII